MEKSRNKNFEKELPIGYKQALYINAKDARLGIILNVIAIAVMVLIMGIAFVALSIGGVSLSDHFGASPFALIVPYLILFAATAAYIVLHELVHGAAYKAMTGERLTFGISWSCAFCGVPNVYTYKRCALISVIAPFAIFSLLLIPTLIILYYVNPIYYLATAFILGLHLGGCSGDLYVTYLLLVRFKGKKTLMRDTGPEQFFYVYTPENKQIQESCNG